jgi:glycosyltransferase involved in cell wall biosynthesis
MSVRILFVVHHPLDPNAGVAGATTQLATAMRAHGCEVQFFSFDDAFGPGAGGRVRQMIAFPVHVARFLAQEATNFDVVDATTGDAWLWLALGRPRGARPVVITHSHGLEHVAHEARVRHARRGDLSLAWRYPLYHGGWRLREVAITLRRADGVIFVSSNNRAWALQHLALDPARTAAIPNGLPQEFLHRPRPQPRRAGEPLEVAVAGAWIPSKGCRTVAEAAHRLEKRGIEIRWRLLGTHLDLARIATEFPSRAAQTLHVTPRYLRPDLPSLLDGAHAYLLASWSEGFNMSLIETMAFGLVPISAPVGDAADFVRPDTGVLLRENPGADDVAEAIAALDSSRNLEELRAAAQQAVQHLAWSDIAERTLDFYRSVRRI